jgi:pyruvate formate lyase activating enzyme
MVSMTPTLRRDDLYTSAPAVKMHGEPAGPAGVAPAAAPPRMPATARAPRPAPPRALPSLGPGEALALLGTPVEDPLAPFSNAPADLTVRCDACAHRCVIREGRLGICRVRENRGGTLVSLVYGEVVAAQVDPMEKKPLFHAYPGQTSLSIATEGCNLHCPFCQNWEISQAPRDGLHPVRRPLPPDAVVREAVAAGARAIAYTYVEPTVFLEYALDTARLARDAGLANVMVTNGYQTPETLALMAPLIDAANVDLKGFSDRFYRRVCGARLEPILESLKEMRRLGTWVEVTTLVIPGENDDPAELAAAAEWIGRELGPQTPWHLSAFSPSFRWTHVPPTPVATLRAARETGRRAGLHHVYLGNIPGDGATDTHCHRCGAQLISRRGFKLVAMMLRDGQCPACGAPLAGIGLAA